MPQESGSLIAQLVCQAHKMRLMFWLLSVHHFQIPLKQLGQNLHGASRGRRLDSSFAKFGSHAQYSLHAHKQFNKNKKKYNNRISGIRKNASKKFMFP